MILSNESIFSDDQAITATALSTNTLDTGVRGTPFRAAAALHGDLGKGNEIPLLIQVTEAFNNLTSLTITLENDSTDAMSSSTVLLTQTIPAAELTVGKKINVVSVPTGAVEQFLRVRYTVTGSAPTAGKITAGIVSAVQTNRTGA